MADIFREVDEDLKREEYLKLWRKYGRFVIAAVALAVIATAAVVGWRQYQERQRLELGRQYQAALTSAESGRTDQALAAFAALAEKGTGYGTLAAFQEAALKAEQGELAAAAAAYDRVAQDPDVDERLRKIATILSVLHELDAGEPEALMARLEPLAAEDSPWRHSARELTALAALRAGQTDRARDLLTRLVDDQTAPAGVRTRAGEVLATLAE